MCKCKKNEVTDGVNGKFIQLLWHFTLRMKHRKTKRKENKLFVVCRLKRKRTCAYMSIFAHCKSWAKCYIGNRWILNALCFCATFSLIEFSAMCTNIQLHFIIFCSFLFLLSLNIYLVGNCKCLPNYCICFFYIHGSTKHFNIHLW